jgi:uncharacterized HAD superfamily protein
MKIGIDLDGVITPIGLINPSLKLPHWLYILLVPIILFMVPTKKEELRKIAKNHEVVIVSARPKWSQKLTEGWLRYHRIPFKKLYCLGFGKGTKERKLKLIREEKIQIFVEDDRKILKFLKQNSINALSNFEFLTASFEGLFCLKEI